VSDRACLDQVEPIESRALMSVEKCGLVFEGARFCLGRPYVDQHSWAATSINRLTHVSNGVVCCSMYWTCIDPCGMLGVLYEPLHSFFFQVFIF
jgi:hypothetical protein